VIGILLTAEDESIRHRLGLREVGSALEQQLQRGRDRALELDLRSPEWVHRISTDTKSTTRIACEILDIVGWTAAPDLTKTSQHSDHAPNVPRPTSAIPAGKHRTLGKLHQKIKSCRRRFPAKRYLQRNDPNYNC
jgi:hypothetical protein